MYLINTRDSVGTYYEPGNQVFFMLTVLHIHQCENNSLKSLIYREQTRQADVVLLDIISFVASVPEKSKCCVRFWGPLSHIVR